MQTEVEKAIETVDETGRPYRNISAYAVKQAGRTLAREVQRLEADNKNLLAACVECVRWNQEVYGDLSDFPEYAMDAMRAIEKSSGV